MRYIKFIIVPLFTIFVSCSSDDGGTEMQTAPVVGVWNLTEANISIPQDPNEDGTASTNMVDELPCLTGTLTVDASGVWSPTITKLNISPVTGHFLCGHLFSNSGVFRSVFISK